MPLLFHLLVYSAENRISTLLSDGEKEILQHTVKGHDAKRIAEITGISVLTVRKHIAYIYIGSCM